MAARQENEIKDILNRLTGNASGPLDAAEAYYNTVLAGGMGAMGANATLTPAALAFMSEELEKQRGKIDAGYFKFDPNQMPQQIKDLLGRTSGNMGTMEDIIRAAGATGDSTALKNAFGVIMGGQTPEMQTLSQVAQAMMAAGGWTGGMGDIRTALLPLLANQGWTPDLSLLSGKGSEMLTNPGGGSMLSLLEGVAGAGGWDEQSLSAFGQGQQIVGERGMTPQLAEILNLILPIIRANGAGGALLPMDQILSFARDAAATASGQQAQAARRNAFQRMGGAVGAGTVEQALAEFADEAARNEAAGVREAATSQQQLQLQQLLGALTSGGDISKSAASNLAAAAQMMSASQSAAAARYGSSVGGYADIYSSQTQRMAAGGNLMAQAAQLALSRLLGGTGGLTDLEKIAAGNRGQASTDLATYINAQLAAGKSITEVLGIEAGRQNTATQALVDLSQLYGTTFQNQQAYDLQSKTAEIGAWLQSMQQQLNTYNSFYGNLNNAAAGLVNIGGQWMGPIQSSIGAYGGISQQEIQNSANSIWNQLLGGIVGGIAGGVGTGVGNVIGRIPGFGKPR